MRNKFKLTKSTAKWLIGIISLITLLAAWQLQHLQISYDFEAFFPKNDSDLTLYQNHVKSFGADNDFVLVAVENSNVIDSTFLSQLAQLQQDLLQSAHVTEVHGLPSIKLPIIGPIGVFEVPLYNLDNFNKGAVTNKIMQDQQLVGTFISKDTSAVALIIGTKANLSKTASDEALVSLKGVLNKHAHMGKFHIAGRIHGQQYYIDLMFWELIIFGASSVALLALFLFISFRTLWGIIIPLLVVLFTVVWLLGGLALANQSISMLTTIMPTILFVVGVSDVVHLIEKYLEELRSGSPKKVALKTAIQEIGLATFLTSLTTSIGFLTLLTASMTPIQEFGIFTSIGVWIAYILAFTLVPALLFLLPKPKIALQSKGFWHRNLHNCFVWMLNHQKSILLGTLALLIIALVGVNKLEVNNYLLEDLSDADPVKKEYQYFENTFDGVRPFEASLSKKDANYPLITEQVVTDLFLLDTYLTETYGLENVIGLQTVVAQFNQGIHGGQIAYRKQPEKQDYRRIEKLINRGIKTGKLNKIINDSIGELRLTGRVIDYGGKIFRTKNKQLLSYWETLPSAKHYQLTITGMAFLIDKNNELISANMLLGLLIAFSLIAILIGFLYKSFRYVIIALIPNMLPLIMVAGFMGYVGIDLKVSTSLIFTIAFGIAVDDTIHFLSKMKLELNKGKSQLYALKRTFLSTGKAIVVTSIILCAGFWTLIFSSFASTFYVGVLISLTLVFAVLFDLLLIPILVMWIAKK
jgi:predicted RND superfamily exporter protein